LIKRCAISSDDSVHTTLSLSRTRRPPGCLPAVIESSIINHVCMVRHQSVTDCDATYLFSGVILILVPEQLKLTLLVVVFSQDETSYLINLKQRGFVSSQLVNCSTYHLTPTRRTLFQLSTLASVNTTQVHQSFRCRVGANGIFRVSGFEVKAQFHTHPSFHALRPYGEEKLPFVSTNSFSLRRSCIHDIAVDSARITSTMLLLSSLVLAILPAVFGFSFEVENSDLTECGSMNIVWSGGTAPYFLTIIVCPFHLSTRNWG
jgi:hypothetical protein